MWSVVTVSEATSPRALTRPCVGFSPTMPQTVAGMRTEPAESVPRASGTCRPATAAAEPPLDPPTMQSVRQGLHVVP